MSKQTQKALFTPDQRQAINRLDLRELIDLKPDPKGERYKYCCPVCGSGTTGAADSNGALHDGHSRGKGWRCFSCGQAKGSPGHDTIGILGYVWQQNPKGVKDRLLKAGLIPADTSQETHQENAQKPQEAPLQGAAIQTIAQQEATQKMLARAEARLQAQADDLAKEAWRYLTEDRRLLSWTIEDTGVGCLEYKGKKAISIPLNAARTRYIVRYLEGSTKYEQQPGLQPDLWNAKALYEGQPVFIVEGAIDGMSIEQTLDESGSSLGAVALCSTGNENIFITRLKQMKADGLKTPRLILALDKDKSGQATTATLAKELADEGIDYSIAAYPDRPDLADEKGKVDPNGFMTKDQAGFQTWLEESAAAPLYEPCQTLADYVEQTFEDDKKEYQRGTLKTGWEKLDDPISGIDGLHVGLCVIGGRPGIGKTTFCWQIVDSLAEQGKQVLYFALEQSAFEMTAKTLARKTGIPNWQIRSGELSEEEKGKIERAKAAYKPLAARLRVIEECGSIDKMISTIKEQHSKGRADCAFIDYLQIIPADGGFKDRIDILDTMMTKLRQTAREIKIPIVVISASNRGSYNQDSGLESYKGSSGIEYSADVALVLQTSTDISTDENKKMANSREIKKEMRKVDRAMKLEIMKNRHGGTGSIELIYHADKDTFE